MRHFSHAAMADDLPTDWKDAWPLYLESSHCGLVASNDRSGSRRLSRFSCRRTFVAAQPRGIPGVHSGRTASVRRDNGGHHRTAERHSAKPLADGFAASV